MASNCAQCGGNDFDTGDTSLQRICTTCGVVSMAQAHSTPHLNENVETYQLCSPVCNATNDLPAQSIDSAINEELTADVIDHPKKNKHSRTCKNCGGTEFDVADLNNSYQKVCVNCGVVFADQSDEITGVDGTGQGFVSSKNDFHCIENLPKHYKQHSGTKRIARGALSALKKYEMFAMHLNLPDFVQEYGKGLLQRALENCKPYHVESKTKVAAACLYRACQHYRQPVTINEVANLKEGWTKYDVMEKYNELCDIFDMDKMYLTFKDRVEVEIKKFKKPLDKDLVDKIDKLTELLETAYITDGRNPRPIITVMIFIVMQASGQCNLSLKKFLSDYNCTVESDVCQARHREILVVLCTAAQKVPWLTVKKVTKVNVLKHLDDILAFRKSFKFDVSKESRTSGLKSASGPATDIPETNKIADDDPGVSTGSANSNSDMILEKMRAEEIKRKRKSGEWVGRHPPCFKVCDDDESASVPKKVRLEPVYNPDLDKVELDDNDMCDSEVDSYIRTDNEVELIKLLLAK